jgi:HSP20 family protein
MAMPMARRGGQYYPALLDPSREFADIYDRMGQLMNLAFSGLGAFGAGGGAQMQMPWVPPADISETEDAYVVRAELPGVNKDQIEVQLQERELVIRGEIPAPGGTEGQQAQATGEGQQAQATGEGQQAEGDGGGQQQVQHRSNRRTGRFELRVYLPGDINPDQISAELSDGVLTVRVPKSEAAKPRRIEVTG